MRRHLRCSIGGSPKDKNEIPPLGTLLHLSNEETNGLAQSSGCVPSRFGIMGASHFHERLRGRRTSSGVPREDPTVETLCTNRPPSGGSRVLFRDICQMGSLAGAAYLLHDNAGVLRQAQWEQKSHVAHKRKGLLD